MFRLYNAKAGWKLEEKSKDEEKIIKKLTQLINNNGTNIVEYLIIYDNGVQDDTYKVINSLDDYIKYMEEYEQKTELVAKKYKKCYNEYRF